MKSGCLGHPWMALAAVVSLAAPVAVAVLPFHVSKTADGPALDALPMPAAILVHEHDASPISTSISSGDQSEPNRLDATTPRALEPGWDSAPPYPGGPAARQADFQEDTDAGSGVQAVGSNRPATARSRGAWLTGNIEEDPREGHGRRPRGVRP